MSLTMPELFRCKVKNVSENQKREDKDFFSYSFQKQKNIFQSSLRFWPGSELYTAIASIFPTLVKDVNNSGMLLHLWYAQRWQNEMIILAIQK